jgi:Pectate lyase superfamily protein
MNKAITDGLVLMPPPFSAGLSQWSREDGTPASASYQGQANAALVPADQDFGGCLELQKTEVTQRLRYKGQTPLQPGLYLRVTARVKAVSGALPSVRIAGYAARSNGTNVTTVPASGTSVALTTYGAVVTVTAIIGSGNRRGNDLVWGTEPVYGHFGLDLTGATGGVVRIDDVVIEDVTEVFHRNMIDVVDVRDYGAVGNGIADDAAAFEAADAAADGRTILVSAGTYFLNANVTLESAVRFEGTVVMPAAMRLACTRNYNLDTYAAAFGSEAEGFRRGLAALFYFTDHVTFDLSGRRVDLTGPVDVAALSGLTVFAQRRVLANGQLNAQSGAGWETVTVTAVATYDPGNPDRLTAVANIAGIPVGARISGTGVGREVYVTSKNVGAATVTLSKPLWGGGGTRTFTFKRHKHMLDFSGFEALSRFEIIDLELACNGFCSAILLSPGGTIFRIADSVINRPKDKGITSTGLGCQGMFIDQCQFLSDEQAIPAQDRVSIAVNTNANDCKIRDNRIVRFAHFAVIGGTGNMLIGNHFFQGDDQANGVRLAGVIFTQTNTKSTLTGNYIDNCSIEWSNEQDPTPGFNNEFSFGALTINGNIFTVQDVSAAFRWLVVRPRGAGHFINGLSVMGNTFRTVNATIDRIEKVDTTTANLDFSRMRNIVFDGNTFNGVTDVTMNPVTVSHQQNTASQTWVVNGASFLPFNGWARTVQAVVADGAITTAADVQKFDMPYVQTAQGSGNDRVNLRWPVDVKGQAWVTLRCDNPS